MRERSKGRTCRRSLPGALAVLLCLWRGAGECGRARERIVDDEVFG